MTSIPPMKHPLHQRTQGGCVSEGCWAKCGGRGRGRGSGRGSGCGPYQCQPPTQQPQDQNQQNQQLPPQTNYPGPPNAEQQARR
eukprot:9998955-Ditylum_brightwellii.AAC.1